ncbi:MAG TPA: DUF58 domain-containing protein [Egibacteraceae bacterium]|nr:DUF58 domain-containing protein [Egibacteraceae bacterium]
MPVLTWRLGAAAVVGAAVVLALPLDPIASIIGVNAGLLAAAAIDWARTPSPSQVGVSRQAPAIVPLGGAAEISWSVANPSPRRLRVSVADELAPSLQAASRQFSVRIPPLGAAGAAVAIRPSRRGRFEPSQIAVRVEGPLGLVGRQERRRVPGTIRVYPPFHSRDEAELRISKARILEVGLRSAKGRGGGTEFDQLREYGPDDEFRRIDWAATARAGKPIVRTHRAERNQTVLLLLDTGRVMAGRVRDPSGAEVPRLDHAMDAVMMLTAVSTRLGDRAGLVAFADTVRAVVPPTRTRDQLGRVTDAMYSLEPELVESDYRGAFMQTLSRFRRRALLVVLTELAEQAVAETLLPALPLVLRSHVVMVAGVRDPAVQRWATAVPAEPGAAYRKAAAVAALDERRRIVSRLRGMGAVVVDAAPGQLAPQLADAYLHVKATGRL